MAFAFSFGNDDVSSEDDQAADRHLAKEFEKTNLDQVKALIAPRRHRFEDFLQAIPSQVSYNLVTIPSQPRSSKADISVPRRALFDINTQLLYEADPSANRQTLLDGIANGDLQSGLYEGGFKTWECSIDLASYVAHKIVRQDQGFHVIELGAGSAIPSIGLLMKLLQHRLSDRGGDQPMVKFTLCDYNEDVLRLCTAVNVFLALLYVQHSQSFPDMPEDGNGEVDVNPDVVNNVLQLLERASIELDFISGAWGDEFLGLLGSKQARSLIVASETIYSLASIEDFTTVLFKWLDRDSDCEVLVAAKKMYFGVGGGIVEFNEVVGRFGGRTDVVLDVPNAGVGRVILEVKKGTK